MATWPTATRPTTTRLPCWRTAPRSRARLAGGTSDSHRLVLHRALHDRPERDELLVEIRIPSPPPRSGSAYLKLERKVGDFATAAVAVQLTLGAGGACEQAGIGLTNVGLTPIKAERAESALLGKRPDDATIAQAAQLAADASQPSEDLRGSVEYKKDLVRVLTARAIRKALERAGR